MSRAIYNPRLALELDSISDGQINTSTKFHFGKDVSLGVNLVKVLLNDFGELDNPERTVVSLAGRGPFKLKMAVSLFP